MLFKLAIILLLGYIAVTIYFIFERIKETSDVLLVFVERFVGARTLQKKLDFIRKEKSKDNKGKKKKRRKGDNSGREMYT
jgi:hypothetical protein